MDVFVELASSLLSFAHQVFGPGLCPGDWVWATSTAGALIALLPITGAFLVALIRKGTGNLYNGTTIGVFGTIGLLTVLLVPLILMLGISETFQQAFAGSGGGLLSSAELGSLNTTLCSFIGDQRVYLGGGENVFETLFYPGGDKLAYGFYLGALGGLPVLSLVFVMLQARLAFRKGPRWPARLFWVPFVLLVACTAGVSANTAVHLWLGFLPVSVLGLVPVAMLGPPSWKALRRSERPREEARPAVPATPAPATPPPRHLRRRRRRPRSTRRRLARPCDPRSGRWPPLQGRCRCHRARARRLPAAGTSGPGGWATAGSAPFGRRWTLSWAARSR